MPPQRKAAAGRKRASPPAAAAESPTARRQKKAAAGPAEQTTTVEVPGFRQDWLAPLYDMYTKREMYDIVLTVGDRSIFAHKVFCSRRTQSSSSPRKQLAARGWCRGRARSHRVTSAGCARPMHSRASAS
jgi:hypothetical protein